MFYPNIIYYKNLLQWKDLNIHHEVKNEKHKLILYKTNKQYQKLDNTFGFDKIIKEEERTFKNYNKSSLIYNSKYSSYKYDRDSKKFHNLFLKSKYSFLQEFLKGWNKFKKYFVIYRIKKKKWIVNINSERIKNINTRCGQKWSRTNW